MADNSKRARQWCARRVLLRTDKKGNRKSPHTGNLTDPVAPAISLPWSQASDRRSWAGRDLIAPVIAAATAAGWKTPAQALEQVLAQAA